MQNEFEKQVQKKLEELDLVPTPPVWQNIEKQIRKDKERRRIVFWLPLGIILIVGAGTWFWIAGNDDAGISKPVTVNIPSQTKEKEKELPSANDVYEAGNNQPSISAPEPSPAPDKTSLARSVEKERTIVSSSGKPSRMVTNNNVALPNQHLQIQTEKKNIAHQKQGNEKQIHEEDKKDQKQTVTETSNPNKIIAIGTGSVDNKNSVNENPAVSSKKDSAKKKDSVLKDVVISENNNEASTIANKGSAKKWKFGIMGGVGFSGEGTGIDLSAEKSMDQFSSGTASPPPVQNMSIPGTPVNKELSFSIGMGVKKELSDRFSLVSGLNFNYYSSSRDVGQQMQDSTLPAGVFISRFYLNSGQVVNNVTSKYYFISLPVMIDWKIIASKPLHLQGGISVQQLISSNAIQFDPQKGIYYKDPSSLKKTQLFTNVTLGYEFSFKNNGSLMLGPSLQYGLNKMSEKENKHLFFAGIHAQYFFK